jgi:thermostable 8-oxoguanine DNA glycosylase
MNRHSCFAESIIAYAQRRRTESALFTLQCVTDSGDDFISQQSNETRSFLVTFDYRVFKKAVSKRLVLRCSSNALRSRQESNVSRLLCRF